MSARTITVEHGGKKYTGHVATIKSTSFGYEDHGILTASLELAWESSGVGFGGFCLDTAKDRDAKDYSREGTAYGLDHLIRIIETVGVEKWEALTGANVIALFDFTESGNTLGSQVKGIAALLGDRVFIPSEHADDWRTRLAAQQFVEAVSR